MPEAPLYLWAKPARVFLRISELRSFSAAGGFATVCMPFTSAPPALYFENQAGRLLADAQGFVRLEWLPGSTDATAVQAVFEQALLLLKNTGWGRMLINQRHLTPFAPALVHWLLTDWFVRATPGHYRRGAILSADNVFARLATTDMVAQARSQHHMLYQYFEAEPAAISWLLNQY